MTAMNPDRQLVRPLLVVVPEERAGVSGSDAILVGEAWISEHYFTTDATAQSFQREGAERRKAWDAEAKEQRPTPRSRFTEARQKLEVDLAALAELIDPDASARRTDAEIVAKAASRGLRAGCSRSWSCAATGCRSTRTGPLLRISAPRITERAPLAVVLAQPVATVEDALAKDAATLLAPHRPRRRRRRVHLGGAAGVGAVRRRRRPRRWCCSWPAAGRCSPSRSAGPRAATSPSTCSWSANATTPSAAARSTAR